MMSKLLSHATLLAVLGLCVACGDDTASGGDGGDSHPHLHIPGQLELCAVSANRFDPVFEDATIFEFRGVLTLGEGMPFDIELGPSMDEAMAGWIPFVLWTAPGADDPIIGSMGTGSAWVEKDRVPNSIYSFGELPGYETAVYGDRSPLGDGLSTSALSDRLLIKVANMSGDEIFDLSDASRLDAEKRLLVYGFAEPGGESYRVVMAPCQVEDAVVDRYDLTLAEGTVSFHTRPAWWLTFDGFTTLAEGQIDDI